MPCRAVGQCRVGTRTERSSRDQERCLSPPLMFTGQMETQAGRREQQARVQASKKSPWPVLWLERGHTASWKLSIFVWAPKDPSLGMEAEVVWRHLAWC